MALGNFRRISLGTLVSLTILAGSVMGLRHAWVGYQRPPLMSPGYGNGRAGFSPDGKRIYVKNADGLVRVVNLSCDVLFGQHFNPGSYIRAYFAPDGKLIVITKEGPTQTYQTHVLDETGRQTGKALGYPSWISRDGKRLFTFEKHTEALHAWELPECRAMTPLNAGHPIKATWAEVSPDGTRVVSGDNTGKVCVLDTTTGSTIAVNPEANNFDVLWTPDGRYFLTCDYKHFRLFDPATGQQIRALQFPAGEFSCYGFGFLPDGRRVLAQYSLRGSGVVRWMTCDIETGIQTSEIERGGISYSFVEGRMWVHTEQNIEILEADGRHVGNIEGVAAREIYGATPGLSHILAWDGTNLELFVRDGDSMTWARYRTPYQRGLLIFFIVLTALVAVILGRCLWRDYKTLRGPARQEQKLGD